MSAYLPDGRLCGNAHSEIRSNSDVMSRISLTRQPPIVRYTLISSLGLWPPSLAVRRQAATH